jgi:hypothetical protein
MRIGCGVHHGFQEGRGQRGEGSSGRLVVGSGVGIAGGRRGWCPIVRRRCRNVKTRHGIASVGSAASSQEACLCRKFVRNGFNYAAVQRERSPLMISNLILRGREPLPAAPWSVLSWGVLLPAVFIGNVALAIVAWYAVEFTMTLF